MNSREQQGCFYVAIGAFFFAFQGIFSKYCTDAGLSVLEVTLGSCVTQAFLSAMVTMIWLYENVALPSRQDALVLFVQGSCNFSSIFLWFQSYTLLDVGDASALSYCYPLFLPLLGCLILGEKTPWFTWLATVGSLGGLVLIARPAFFFPAVTPVEVGMGGHAMGTLFALSAAITFAFYIVAVRILGEVVHPVICSGYMALVGIFVVCPAVLLLDHSGSPAAAAAAVIDGGADLSFLLQTAPVGMSGFLACVLATKGYQLAPAAQAAVLSLLDIVYSFAAQPLLFGEPLEPLSVCGAALVLSGCLLQTVLGAASEQGDETKAQDGRIQERLLSA